MAKPFDGAISTFFDSEAPKEVRSALKDAGKKDILSDSYPYSNEMDKDDYENAIEAL